MKTKDKKIFQKIDSMIQSGASFAFYRLPGENTIHFIQQDQNTPKVLLYDVEELNGQTGFVIAPFKVDSDTPIVLLKPDQEKIIDAGFIKKQRDEMDSVLDRMLLNFRVSSSESESPTEEYAGCFNVFINALKEKEFDKLVLSRSQKLNMPSDFSLALAFCEACCRYIHSYIYLCHTPETGTWLGSTPEILLCGEDKDWNTVALAGTQLVAFDILPKKWTDKNQEEQQYVASYVRERLHTFGVQPTESEPYSVLAGTLAHLKTDFHFTLPDNERLGDLLKLLHPTPAVCGLPKEKAYQFILDHEAHDRRYYSGFIGMLNPSGKTDLYVNLRCMNITHKSLTLYAGGGLLNSSTLKDEWDETEVKMEMMLNLVED